MKYPLLNYYPRQGVECKFYLVDGTDFIGYYDSGGATLNPIIIRDTTNNKDYRLPDTVELFKGWEYTGS